MAMQSVCASERYGLSVQDTMRNCAKRQVKQRQKFVFGHCAESVSWGADHGYYSKALRRVRHKSIFRKITFWKSSEICRKNA